ncbi:MAG: cell division protein [Bacteroidia bacterium]
MKTLHLETLIHAPVERCFDLSRSIDLHKLSTAKTEEEAIAGKMSGLIGLGESVTWKARHFGVMQKMTVEITDFDTPVYFQDQMSKGIFKSFRHEHFFEAKGENCLMKDLLVFEAPLGRLGKLAEKWVLGDYLRKLLLERNELIKIFAESERWCELAGMESKKM